MKKKPAVILDRDGTLLTERGYLGDPDRMILYPQVFKALKILRRLRLPLVIVSNQSGVGRGYFSSRRVDLIHDRLRAVLRRKGIRLDGIFYCPHRPTEGCACRKPKTGLARKAARKLGIDLKKSYVVGDQMTDMNMAKSLGARGVLVLTGAGRLNRRKARRLGCKVTRDILTASRWIGYDRGKMTAGGLL